MKPVIHIIATCYHFRFSFLLGKNTTVLSHEEEIDADFSFFLICHPKNPIQNVDFTLQIIHLFIYNTLVKDFTSKKRLKQTGFVIKFLVILQSQKEFFIARHSE